MIAAQQTTGDTPASDAEAIFYVTDNLGSVVVLLDHEGEKAGGYSYDPYGQERTITEGEAEENIIRYAGAQYDADTELYKMGHRYYDPTTGRFTQPDPSGAENSQYTYAAGNPINYTDPTGLQYSEPNAATECLIFVSSMIGSGGIGAAAVASARATAGTVAGAPAVAMGASSCAEYIQKSDYSRSTAEASEFCPQAPGCADHYARYY